MAYTKTSIQNFLKKNSIAPEDIRYIVRDSNETSFHLLDSRIISTLIPLNHFQDYFSASDFTRINKSALICNRQVVNVSKGSYLMTDGVVLEGRHHSIKKHTDFMRELITEQNTEETSAKINQLKSKLSAFDDLPVPYCVIQLVFDVYGKSTGFVFRYCNSMMALMDQQPVESFIDRSFFQVFENYPPEEWLVNLGDVARNGGLKVFHIYNERYQGFLYLLCYQLAPDCCGCLFIPHGWINVLNRLNPNILVIDIQ